MRLIQLTVFIACLGIATTSMAESSTPSITQEIQQAAQAKTSLSERQQQEEKIEENPFGISLYKPSYALPFYHTSKPDQAVYGDSIPDKQQLRKTEFKAQISAKVPIVRHIFHTKTDLYGAYTQLFYWQVYTKSAYFRETNYEPEIFFSHKFANWSTGNIGIVHQSNGRGGSLERSWNRIYAEGIFSFGHAMVSFKPWVLIFKNNSSNLHNPDITHFLGHGRFLFAYKYHKNVFSIWSRNNLESWFRRGAVNLSWSFPIFGHFSGYVQFFTGYGQSLIEYNHYTNGFGVGITLNNWI